MKILIASTPATAIPIRINIVGLGPQHYGLIFGNLAGYLIKAGCGLTTSFLWQSKLLRRS
jgi:hypothetical protein